MQVLCKATKGNAETHCCVCGQGFVMFWDRQSRSERFTAQHEIQETFRRHHRSAPGPEAHPTGIFPVPDWNESTERADTAASGAAPLWGI